MAWKFGTILGASMAIMASFPAEAHHSFAAVFDDERPIELTGTLSSVEWMNPHVWFYLSVENDQGEPETWAFEMGSPNRLARSGWHQNSMQLGLTVIVAGSLARDGSRKVAVETVTLSTGQRLFGAQDSSQ